MQNGNVAQERKAWFTPHYEIRIDDYETGRKWKPEALKEIGMQNGKKNRKSVP